MRIVEEISAESSLLNAVRLELSMLQRLYTLQRIHKEVRPTSHIYLATPMTLGVPYGFDLRTLSPEKP